MEIDIGWEPSTVVQTNFQVYFKSRMFKIS